jgi:hypothetical protein
MRRRPGDSWIKPYDAVLQVGDSELPVLVLSNAGFWAANFFVAIWYGDFILRSPKTSFC